MSEEYRNAAELLGKSIAQRGMRLVYGGAHLGLMGAVADSCLAEGGYVTGVIPQALVDREIAHRGLTELHIVHSMHARKALMADLSDAFIALPGGLGTFEELLEIATWSQLELQQKTCGLVNIAGYYDGLITQLDCAVHSGFLSPEHRGIVLIHSDPLTALDLVTSSPPVIRSKFAG